MAAPLPPAAAPDQGQPATELLEAPFQQAIEDVFLDSEDIFIAAFQARPCLGGSRVVQHAAGRAPRLCVLGGQAVLGTEAHTHVCVCFCRSLHRTVSPHPQVLKVKQKDEATGRQLLKALGAKVGTRFGHGSPRAGPCVWPRTQPAAPALAAPAWRCLPRALAVPLRFRPCPAGHTSLTHACMCLLPPCPRALRHRRSLPRMPRGRGCWSSRCGGPGRTKASSPTCTCSS